jgi:hypothetical protein
MYLIKKTASIPNYGFKILIRVSFPKALGNTLIKCKGRYIKFLKSLCKNLCLLQIRYIQKKKILRKLCALIKADGYII